VSWLGAGIGAGIGLTIGGPIGAAIGAWLGSSLVDNVIKNNKSNNISFATQEQGIFFVTLFSMLAKLAKADGVISKSEIDVINDFFKQLNLSTQDRKEAIIIFNNAKNDNSSIYEYAKQYSRISNDKMCHMIYAILWQVAMADGELHSQEELILKRLTDYLNISYNHFEVYKQKYGLLATADISLASAYKTLGCKEDDSDKTIKQRYRKAVAEYHPDKIQNRGLPENFIKYANDQIKHINVAYELIQKHRNNR
jgi:DnaJ like chaperone protein